MLHKSIGLLIALIDIICEIADLERAGIFFGHGLDSLLHVVELIHIFSDLFVFLVHIFLDLDGEFVERALGRVAQTLPLEFADVLSIRH